MINTAEKIETIVQCRNSGTFGEFVEYEPGKFRVTADNFTVLVRCDDIGWHVFAAGFEGIDRELYIAATMALEARKNAGAPNAIRCDLSKFINEW